MHKKGAISVGLFIILAAFIMAACSLSAGTLAKLSCTIQTGGSCTTGTAVLHVKNDTGGYDNAHAQLANQTGYDNYVCCGINNGTVTTACGSVFLELSGQTNAHVQDPDNESIFPDYDLNACMGGAWSDCKIESGSCSAGYSCLLSMASSGGNNYTNAHVANCSHYMLQVCCKMNSPPAHGNPKLNSTSGNNLTIDNITCYNQSTQDADSNIVINTYNWYFNGRPLMLLNMPFNINLTNASVSGSIIDYSGFNNSGIGGNGNESRTPVWNSSGKVGGAYDFDGSDDYIVIPDSDNLDTSWNYSIEMWVYNRNGTKSYPTLFNRAGQSGTNGFFWTFTGGTNKTNIRFQYSNGTDYLETTFTNALPLDTWSHAIFTFVNSTSELRLYINGVQNGTTRTLTNYSAVDDGNFFIGVYQGTITSYPFWGSIDEFRIYNKSLSASQVYQRWLETKDGFSNGSVIVSQETGRGDVFMCQITPSDGLDDGPTKNSTVLTIANNAPNLTSVSESNDPIMGGALQTITPSGQNDTDHDDLYLYCCNDTVNTCTPTSVNDVCSDNFFSYPYTSMNCTFNAPVMNGLLYVRCRTYDGLLYSAATASTNFTVDSTAPVINISSPQNITYSTSTIDLNATVSENASSCWWNIGGSNDTMSNSSRTVWYDTINTGGEGFFHLYVYCNDTSGNMGVNSSIYFSVVLMGMQITKAIDPYNLVADENESVNVTLDVKVNQTKNIIPEINITDEIPYDFTAPSAANVRVYFIDYYPIYSVIDITGNTTVTVGLQDMPGTQNTRLYVNISNISKTDAASYINENDTIRVFYNMTSSRMEANATRVMYTNVTIRDNETNTKTGWKLSYIYSSQIVIRGYKDIWIPDLSAPQNLSVELVFRALGGPVSGILIADYLPNGATIHSRNVTYYNHTSGQTIELLNGSDFYVGSPTQTTLPDGMYVDVYHYNFSYQYVNWDGNLYDNDIIRIRYNISVLGGGQWYLPAIISGYDPSYQKNIKTEMYAETNVPSFDVMMEMLTDTVKQGEVVKALLRILNVGGPRAKVDVFITYSIKTMKGEIIAEKSETLAVVEQKEKSLEITVPKDLAPGVYTFESYVTYTGREALSTGTFTVVGEAEKNIMELYGPYIFPSIIVLIFAVMYMRASRKGRKAPAAAAVMVLILAGSSFLPMALAQGVLDIKLDILSKAIEPGDEAKALLKINNMNFTGYKTDIFVQYSLVDPKGNVIKMESGTFPMTDSREILLKLETPENAGPGRYAFQAEVLLNETDSMVYEGYLEITGGQEWISYAAPVALFLIVSIVTVLFFRKKKK